MDDPVPLIRIGLCGGCVAYEMDISVREVVVHRLSGEELTVPIRFLCKVCYLGPSGKVHVTPRYSRYPFSLAVHRPLNGDEYFVGLVAHTIIYSENKKPKTRIVPWRERYWCGASLPPIEEVMVAVVGIMQEMKEEALMSWLSEMGPRA